MGLLGDRIKKEKKKNRANMVVSSISGALYRFVKGFPKGAEEKEIAVMLSPGQEDIDVYIVALSDKAKIVRVCTQFKGSALAAKLFSLSGMDLSRFIPDQALTDIQNEQNDECTGTSE